MESDDSEREIFLGTQKGRRNIRNVKGVEELATDTKVSNLNENERLKRIENLQKKFSLIIDVGESEDQLILDYDFAKNIPNVSVHKNLVNKLKNHQKEGVRFMWNACFESLSQIKNSPGSGCILAHCMGLGKSLQVVTLVHTVLSHKETKVETVLICCPKNTILNWINEFNLWINSDMESISVYNPTKYDDHDLRLNELSVWQLCGGVCIINYELLRLLLENENKSTKQLSIGLKKKFYEYLCDPGPDIIVCDEGHVLKNEDTRLYKIMNKIRTLRRIILTGTPMQNNLKEYYCMVQFVKPHLLGTRTEFLNMFANPISNGQYENSLPKDVQLMKERSHILHKKLVGCVQRFDLSILKQFLPEKHEYVIFTPLTDCQIDMYRSYMKNYSAKEDPNWKKYIAFLFADYQALQRIWTHPFALKIYEDKHADLLRQSQTSKKKTKKKKVKVNEEEVDELSDIENYCWSRCSLTWWTQFISIESIDDVRQSYKLMLLLKLLQEFEEVGEKVLLFSGSLYSLEVIEHFLKKINNSCYENPSLCNMTSTWEEGEDYLILTGQTSAKDRDFLCKKFNNVNNIRLRLFLISTKAGGIGINLTAASRAILFDVSWNPSYDVQSIFRIYRIGQTKPCFIYRLVASGTMEEKIYERQVAKQSISYRVVDELQTARHFTAMELLKLYTFEPYKTHAVNIPDIKDPILQKVLKDSLKDISGIHEHDSLLEHKQEEELEEAEKNIAWNAYNNDVDLDVLSDDIKAILKTLKPEDFDVVFYRKALKIEYPFASEVEIDTIVEETMPSVKLLLENPNFIEIMSKEALKVQREKLKNKDINKKSKIIKRKNLIEKPKKKNSLDSSRSDSSKNPILVSISSSDSEDCFLVREINQRKRKRKKPLKTWGRKGIFEYGSPSDS